MLQKSTAHHTLSINNRFKFKLKMNVPEKAQVGLFTNDPSFRKAIHSIIMF